MSIQLINSRIKELQWRLHHHYATRFEHQVNLNFVAYIENEINKLKEILELNREVKHG